MSVRTGLLIGWIVVALGCTGAPEPASQAEPVSAASPTASQASDATLVGTAWLVEGFDDGEHGLMNTIPGTTLHLAFDEEGRVSGSAGCNSLSGSFKTDGTTLAFGPMATTRMMCPDPISGQESAFLTALAGVTTWAIAGERLEFRTAERNLAVTLASAVTGSVRYNVRRGLPPHAEIRVTLEDVSLADVPSTLIGETSRKADGKQAPFPFTIAFDPTAIQPGRSYGLRATIKVDDKLLFTSTRAYPVITRDNPRYDVEIEVDLVGGS